MTRLLGAVLVLAVMVGGGAAGGSAGSRAANMETATAVDAAAAAAGVRVTRSHYMANANHGAARNLGCRDGDTRGRMTLFFGAPQDIGGDFGATLWGAPDRTTAQIAEIVKEFARGYVWCRRSDGHQLLIGVGTSTSTIDSRSDGWLRRHGRAWSAMVKQLDAWAKTHHPDGIVVDAAWDAEPSWSSFHKAEQWMAGYDNETPGARPLHANNSADGCPSVVVPNNGGCNNGWNQQHVWHLAWEHRPAFPIPQIYATSGVNAHQWAMLSLYGAGRGNAIHFGGAMSQRSACQQRSGCEGIDATPQQSHDFLLWALNARPETRQPSLDGVTDIRWHS